MGAGETVAWPITSERETRNIRRNVSQNGVRNDKAFRVKLDREASTMRVTRVR
jgi:hypothetical protein